jgi:P4 family phage/plasmid primase-like protien
VHARGLIVNAGAFQRVLNHFSARAVGAQMKGVCPACGHHALLISEGDKRPAIAWCGRCKDAAQDQINKEILDCIDGGRPFKPVYVPPRKPKRSISEEELWTKWEGSKRHLESDKRAQEFVNQHGIGMDVAANRLGSGNFYGADRIVIPYFDGTASDKLLQLRYRQINVPRNVDGTENKENKWRSDKVTTGVYRLYNLPMLRNREDRDPSPVVGTESELDALLCENLGIRAFSIDSAGHKLTEEDRTLLLTIPHLSLAFDQDDDGFECTKRFALTLPGVRMIGGYGEVAKDLGDYRRFCVAQGQDFGERLSSLVEDSLTHQQEEPTRTDAGNGQRFVRRNSDIVRRCKKRGDREDRGWFVWNGITWRPDNIGMTMELARQTANDIATKAATDLSAGVITKGEFHNITMFVLRSLSHNSLEHMLAQAGAGSPLCIEGDVFDSRPELVNMRNGTYNLETGEFYRNRKEDLLTQCINVSFDPTATCPLWMKYLDGVTQGNAVVQGYLRRVFGYLLTGSQREQKFFVIYGPPGTGKSVYIAVLKGVLGEYFCMVAEGMFLKSKYGSVSANSPTPAVAALAGKRVACTAEMTEGDCFDAGMLKKITGGEALTGRNLYAGLLTFQPQCKPIFVLNHIPGTNDFSGAMGDRMRIVSFEHRFRNTSQEIKNLAEKLIPEYPGILNWALNGHDEWLEHGLGDPPVIKSATDAYMESENPVSRWLQDETIADVSGVVPFPEAFRRFFSWASGRQELCGTDRWFGRRMSELGRPSTPVFRKGRCFHGFVLNNDNNDKG